MVFMAKSEFSFIIKAGDLYVVPVWIGHGLIECHSRFRLGEEEFGEWFGDLSFLDERTCLFSLNIRSEYKRGEMVVFRKELVLDANLF